MASPTARTLASLRRAGFIACVVERWIAQRGIRIDAFNFADILAASPIERRIVLVQATSVANIPARVKKIQSKPEAATWLNAGGEIQVWGWCQRAGRWRVKIVSLTATDMQPVVITKPKRKLPGNWETSSLFD